MLLTTMALRGLCAGLSVSIGLDLLFRTRSSPIGGGTEVLRRGPWVVLNGLVGV
jgi:hypothetical protein